MQLSEANGPTIKPFQSHSVPIIPRFVCAGLELGHAFHASNLCQGSHGRCPGSQDPPHGRLIWRIGHSKVRQQQQYLAVEICGAWHTDFIGFAGWKNMKRIEKIWTDVWNIEGNCNPMVRAFLVQYPLGWALDDQRVFLTNLLGHPRISQAWTANLLSFSNINRCCLIWATFPLPSFRRFNSRTISCTSLMAMMALRCVFSPEKCESQLGASISKDPTKIYWNTNQQLLWATTSWNDATWSATRQCIGNANRPIADSTT